MRRCVCVCKNVLSQRPPLACVCVCVCLRVSTMSDTKGSAAERKVPISTRIRAYYGVAGGRGCVGVKKEKKEEGVVLPRVHTGENDTPKGVCSSDIIDTPSPGANQEAAS